MELKYLRTDIYMGMTNLVVRSTMKKRSRLKVEVAVLLGNLEKVSSCGRGEEIDTYHVNGQMRWEAFQIVRPTLPVSFKEAPSGVVEQKNPRQSLPRASGEQEKAKRRIRRTEIEKEMTSPFESSKRTSPAGETNPEAARKFR